MTRMTGLPNEVLCARTPELMFPVDESRNAGQATPGERRALAVCLVCPLLTECRSVVLSMEMPYGVAGGLTAADRRAVRAGGRRSNAGVAASTSGAPRVYESTAANWGSHPRSGVSGDAA